MANSVSILPNERIGVVFLHHRADPVTRRNLESFREHNPGMTLVTVTSDERIEGGYSIHDDATFSRRWQEHTSKENGTFKRRAGDLLLYYWYLNRREQCDRWLVVEWDAFCAMPVREFIAPVAAFPFVAASIRVRRRESEWHWFFQVNTLPNHLRPFACGVVPSAFLILKDEVLKKMVAMVPWEHLGKCNAELRLGTLAHAAGYMPVAHPLAGSNIVWQALPIMNPIPYGMWHPIKFLVPPTGSNIEPLEIEPIDYDESYPWVPRPPVVKRIVKRLKRMTPQLERAFKRT